jgi:tungstate transport system substrate-binding protein
MSRAHRLVLLLVGLSWLAPLTAPAVAGRAVRTLVLATTTSTQDTGLLDDLLPAFEARTHIRVKTVAVGSGEALAMGRRGDADVLLVHSKAAEDAFMAEGHGAERLDVMANDFVVIGPDADPAGIRGADAVEAFGRIAAKRARFVSRGDRSGTNVKELDLWKRAGVDPLGASWYVSAGQGMGETARIAAEKRAYTLSDRGTYLALASRLDLVVLSEGGADLLNTYRVIVVNPARHPRTHAREARAFARGKYGRSLFTPDAR